ncbi:hypothetical protein HF673_01150 [Acidithiobacillus thiooxidans]|jgi:type IV secretion system protein VirB2|uniref:TrbC/VirB2 family protein n=1 Tax=Acidithiobacillus thiooxidans TaxID=930 RepID=UPI001C070D9A|nr:TrbC/VirB2 family protein [Acidithiobacillus thiooxidans]MBU2834422.1 hypothetical protein [Acidithiobacillus thiooxidans]
MEQKNRQRNWKKFWIAFAAVCVSYTWSSVASAATAGGGGSMPWDTWIGNIQSNLTGPTAHILILLSIGVTGGFWAFGKHSEAMHRIMGIAAGGSIMVGADSLYETLSAGGSGAIIH